MRRSVFVLGFVMVFGFGVVRGSLAVAKKDRVTSEVWNGRSPAEAAGQLLDISIGLAEGGSWETIHVGRVHYLSGDQATAEHLFEKYRSGKSEASDLVRIGRVYEEAGDWDKARPIFDRVLQLSPKDEDWLVEIGAYYNLHGDRAHAEELFERGFDSAPKNLNNALTAAGSYVGVAPRRR